MMGKARKPCATARPRLGAAAAASQTRVPPRCPNPPRRGARKKGEGAHPGRHVGKRATPPATISSAFVSRSESKPAAARPRLEPGLQRAGRPAPMRGLAAKGARVFCFFLNTTQGVRAELGEPVRRRVSREVDHHRQAGGHADQVLPDGRTGGRAGGLTPGRARPAPRAQRRRGSARRGERGDATGAGATRHGGDVELVVVGKIPHEQTVQKRPQQQQQRRLRPAGGAWSADSPRTVRGPGQKATGPP